MKFFLFLFCYIFFLHSSDAAYYDTLPEGVRNITYRNIQTGNIKGSYGGTGDFKGYNVKVNIDADSIKGISSAVNIYLDSLNAADYANFSFGTFEGEANSKVSAQAFGLGYGVTNQLTIYAYAPFYNAEVDLSIERTQKGRSNIGSAIQIENLPDADIRLIQSLFVNYYHYQPLGKWKASDFGDTELGMMYQLNKTSDGGSLINFGAVVPTGRKNNPDILQDIAFGDGQWDAFLELGGGRNLSDNWSFDNWTRLTYQFPYSTTVRTPTSSIYPITANSTLANIKLGNKAQTNLQINYKFSEEWMTSLIYSLEYTEKTKYKSSNELSDSILEQDTEKLSQTAKVNLGYTTMSLYDQKKFFAPMNFNLSAQSVVAGKNIPKYERADFEIQIFF